MTRDDVIATQRDGVPSTVDPKDLAVPRDTDLPVFAGPLETSRDRLPIIPTARRGGAAESSSSDRHSIATEPAEVSGKAPAGAELPAKVLQVRALSKTYIQRRVLSWKAITITALNNTELTVQPDSTLGLVGESGSGKSTLAKCMALLERPDSGEIWFDGRNLLSLRTSELRRARRQIQIVFQDPVRALNPRFSAVELVAEPLEILRWDTHEARRRRALDLMEEVGLSRHWGNRPALDFSGGQRQRLAIARALALEPRILVLDEALSALDLPLQKQIMNLLLDLQVLHGFSCVLISHDLGLVARVADRVAVMHQGSIVEQGKVRDLFAAPQHTATKALLESAR
jgi:ABC-type glutathione transport system ATPase component